MDLTVLDWNTALTNHVSILLQEINAHNFYGNSGNAPIEFYFSEEIIILIRL